MGELRTAWSSIVVALCAVGLLLAVPFLVLLGFLGSMPVFGTSTHRGDGYLTWAAWLGAGLPLVGVVVSATTRRRGWIWFFGICLAVVAVVATLNWVDDVRHAPPERAHCVENSVVEHSGGNECPGG